MRQDPFFAEVDRAFGIRAHGQFEPNTDVYIDEAHARMVVHVELAGSDGDELRVAVDERYLYIMGTRTDRAQNRIARRGAEAVREFMGTSVQVNLDTVIAGAILADVGKLLEYEIGPDGFARQSAAGEALRHPFTGVALALECAVPADVCHIIAAHAAEGGLVKRSLEAWIVHHADFMAFDPFKDSKK